MRRVFELTRGSGKTVDEQIIHAFGANEAGGLFPYAPVVFNRRGDMFGATLEGGSASCECGTIFGMKQEAGGKWGFEVLHRFVGTDGSDPQYGMTLDSKGNLYGTTKNGGPYSGGVVFELSPTAQASK